MSLRSHNVECREARRLGQKTANLFGHSYEKRQGRVGRTFLSDNVRRYQGPRVLFLLIRVHRCESAGKEVVVLCALGDLGGDRVF